MRSAIPSREMRCQSCERELSADEVVYRAAIGHSGIWYEKFGKSSVGSLCRDCVTGPRAPIIRCAQSQLWRPEMACEHCGRPVILSGRRPQPAHVACDKKCLKAMYNRRRRVPEKRGYQRERHQHHCRRCGKIFLAVHLNAQFCSSACRQAAYRDRSGVATTPPRRAERGQ